jgi:hypothetical protein
MSWKYTDESRTVVMRIREDGATESVLIEVIADWIAEGNTPEDPPVIDKNILIQSQIDEIERSTLMNRGSREGWIEVLRKEAAIEGITDDAVIAQYNPFFKRLIEVNEQVKALRSQLT